MHNSPPLRRTGKRPRRIPASPKSPRMLRRPRGGWYRERYQLASSRLFLCIIYFSTDFIRSLAQVVPSNYKYVRYLFYQTLYCKLNVSITGTGHVVVQHETIYNNLLLCSKRERDLFCLSADAQVPILSNLQVTLYSLTSPSFVPECM